MSSSHSGQLPQAPHKVPQAFAPRDVCVLPCTSSEASGGVLASLRLHIQGLQGFLSQAPECGHAHHRALPDDRRALAAFTPLHGQLEPPCLQRRQAALHVGLPASRRRRSRSCRAVHQALNFPRIKCLLGRHNQGGHPLLPDQTRTASCAHHCVPSHPHLPPTLQTAPRPRAQGKRACSIAALRAFQPALQSSPLEQPPTLGPRSNARGFAPAATSATLRPPQPPRRPASTGRRRHLSLPTSRCPPWRPTRSQLAPLAEPAALDCAPVKQPARDSAALGRARRCRRTTPDNGKSRTLVPGRSSANSRIAATELRLYGPPNSDR